MSVQAISWALSQQTGDTGAKLVLVALANYADADGSCWPGQELLAEQCEVSTATIKRKLAILKERGLITVETRYSSVNRGRSSNLYVLALDLQPLQLKSDDLQLTAMSQEPSLEPHSSVEQALPPRGAEAPREPESPKPPRPLDLIFEAVFVACYPRVGPYAALTRDARGRVNAAVRQFKEIGATPEDITRAAREARRLWPGIFITPQTLTGNWAQLHHVSGRVYAAALTPPCSECEVGGGMHLADCSLAGDGA